MIQPCSFKTLQGFFSIELFTARHAELVSASHSPCTLPTPKGLNTNSPESQLGATRNNSRKLEASQQPTSQIFLPRKQLSPPIKQNHLPIKHFILPIR